LVGIEREGLGTKENRGKGESEKVDGGWRVGGWGGV